MKHISHHTLLLPGGKPCLGWIPFLPPSPRWVLGRAGSALSFPWGTKRKREIGEGAGGKEPGLVSDKIPLPLYGHQAILLGALKENQGSLRGTVASGKQKLKDKILANDRR